jgi:hypothetical protein
LHGFVKDCVNDQFLDATAAASHLWFLKY